jgi:hypothetical protein
MAIGVLYEMPVAGATPPTAAQGAQVSEVSALITGDGATATVVLTHNLGSSAADLTAGLPEVTFEPLLPAFYTEVPRVTAKAANTITLAFLGTAATQFMRVRLRRPNTITR